MVGTVTAVLRVRVVKMLRSSFMAKSPRFEHDVYRRAHQLEGRRGGGERCMAEVVLEKSRGQMYRSSIGTSHYCRSVGAEEGYTRARYLVDI